jgi:hydroxymethylbilane synthase
MRLGTRRSALAMAQANAVAALLGPCELVPILTSGDRGAERDKSRWVAELEQALLAGEIDVAVHSAKDVPSELAAGLELVGATERRSPEDVLCGARSLEELPAGARVGTSSVRRTAQLRAVRDDLQVVPIRGNVDTRLRKLADGEGGLVAIVLARAGLQRLRRDAEVSCALDPERFVPAPGQGALALEARAGEERVREALRPALDAISFTCLRAERALAQALGADCHTPLGAHAVSEPDGGLRLSAWIGVPDGSAWASDVLRGGMADPVALGREAAARLHAVGADGLLEGARATAAAGAG